MADTEVIVASIGVAGVFVGVLICTVSPVWIQRSERRPSAENYRRDPYIEIVQRIGKISQRYYEWKTEQDDSEKAKKFASLELSRYDAATAFGKLCIVSSNDVYEAFLHFYLALVEQNPTDKRPSELWAWAIHLAKKDVSRLPDRDTEFEQRMVQLAPLSGTNR